MGYVVGDCSLGQDLRFEIPSNYEYGSLIVKDGELFNATTGNITLYCESFPDYSFRLSAWDGLQYRTSSSAGYSYVDLPLTVDSGPVLSLRAADVFLIGALLISALLIICKGGAKRD